MEQSGSAPNNPVADRGAGLNWPLIRKIETLIFLGMFIAVPFFALRTVGFAATQMAVSNTVHGLVQDIRKARDMAKESHLTITVASSPPTKTEKRFSYAIQNGTRNIIEVILPPGISLTGNVSYDENGVVSGPASFVCSMAGRVQNVEVDSSGTVFVP